MMAIKGETKAHMMRRFEQCWIALEESRDALVKNKEETLRLQNELSTLRNAYLSTCARTERLELSVFDLIATVTTLTAGRR